ncbi:phosphatase, partial [Streptomyces sp. NPDC005568]
GDAGDRVRIIVEEGVRVASFALAPSRVLGLAPRLCAARTALDCVRTVVEECGETEREDDACVLVARVMS